MFGRFHAHAAFAATATVCAFGASALAGQTVNVEFKDTKIKNINTSGGQGIDDQNPDGAAGAFNIVVDDFGWGTDFVGFCIEIAQYINTNKSYTYEVGDAASAPQPSTGVDPNWSGMGATKESHLIDWFDSHFWELGGNNFSKWDKSDAVAFQIGVWEIVAESGTDYDVTKGDFKVTRPSDDRDTANGWLNDMDFDGQGSTKLRALTNDDHQDMIIATSVPTPAVAALAVPMIGFVVGARVRRRHQA